MLGNYIILNMKQDVVGIGVHPNADRHHAALCRERVLETVLNERQKQ